MKFIDEFKAFALKGNVVDMAVGVVVGGAFGKIVTSLVNDLIMPLLGLLTGGASFTDLKVVLAEEMVDGVMTPVNTLNYGVFIQTIIDFILIALSIFMFVKILSGARNRMHKKEIEAAAAAKAAEEAAKAAEPAKPTSEELLCEIRDLLKEKK